MDDQAPTGLKLNIAAFRAIAAAVTEAEIGGEVAAVTITAVKPDLQLMADAVAVELTSSNGEGRQAIGSRRGSWPATVASSPTSRTRPQSPTRTERAGGAAAARRCVPSCDAHGHRARAGAARRLPLRAHAAARVLARGAAAHARGQVRGARRRRGGLRSPCLWRSAPVGAAGRRDQAWRGPARRGGARGARGARARPRRLARAGDGEGLRLRQADDGHLLRGAVARTRAHRRSRARSRRRAGSRWPIRRCRWASTPTRC